MIIVLHSDDALSQLHSHVGTSHELSCRYKPRQICFYFMLMLSKNNKIVPVSKRFPTLDLCKLGQIIRVYWNLWHIIWLRRCIQLFFFLCVIICIHYCHSRRKFHSFRVVWSLSGVLKNLIISRYIYSST